MSILLYGQKADRTHENKMLRAFIQALKADWAGSGKDITLIANSMWDGNEVDLVCLLPTAVLIVDFKHYSGHLVGGENGPWRMNGDEVQGGSKANPYQQIRDYKFAIIGWLEKQGLLAGQNIGHINGAVVFTGPITGGVDISIKASYWFHTTDIAGSSATLADLASTALRVTPRDIEAIKKTLAVQAFDFDFGQCNYQPKPALEVIKPPAIESISTESDKKPKQTACASSTIKESAPVSIPVQKNRMSGMFKSAVAVGGVFLVMAVVSQIYPTVGQSSPVAVEEPRQPSYVVQEPRSSIVPVINTPKSQPKAQPVAARNTITAASTHQIDARLASNYIGQEVTACGTVAQSTPFKKGVYLNLDKPYPKQSLTIVIWHDMLTAVESKFGKVSSLVGVELCANGQVGEYKQQPRIEISDVSALHTLSFKTNGTQPMLTNTNTNTNTNINIKATQNETSAERIEAYRAPFYVGKQVMACGVLAGTSKFSKGMYLSLDKKYPNQTLTLVVWNESIAPLEAKFGVLNSKIGHTFCALGTIERYKKNLQIQIENPQFLRLMRN